MREPDGRGARVISIVAAVFIALACGTNYAYSTWAPQFAERMRLSSTASNLIGSFGNLGMYIPAILVGIVIDSKGPRLGVGLGAVLLGIGYAAIYSAFKSGPGSFNVASLCFFSFLTGCGSCAAFLAALKTAAVNFPQSRGTATGLPLAGYGLSAFMFSIISSFAFSDDTSMFLLMLAIVTTALNSVALFFIRLLPPSQSTLLEQTRHGLVDSQELRRTRSHDGGGQNAVIEGRTAEDSPAKNDYDGAAEDQNVDAHETSSLLSKFSDSNSEESGFDSRTSKGDDPAGTDIRGLALLAKVEFWELFLMFGLFSGIGLMNINNLGNDVTALWRHYDPSATPAFIASQQSVHVSILSVASCAGRLISGAGSDLLVKKLKMNRVWCLFISALAFIAAQFSALQIENPRYLGFVSGLTGFAYGVLYGFFPSLLAKKFGVNGMSQNWGTIILAPVISGNLFNLLYGQIYDNHSVSLPDGEQECLQGLSCYWTASLVTLFAALAGATLSLGSIWRENRNWKHKDGAQIRSNHDRDV